MSLDPVPQSSFTSISNKDAMQIFSEQKENATAQLEKYKNHIITDFQKRIDFARGKANHMPPSSTKQHRLDEIDEIEQKFKEDIATIFQEKITSVAKEIEQARRRYMLGQSNFAATQKQINKISFKVLKGTKEEAALRIVDLSRKLLPVRLGAHREKYFVDYIITKLHNLVRTKETVSHWDRGIQKELSSQANPKWKTYSSRLEFADGTIAKSRLIPASEMPTRAINVKGKTMLASGERAAAADVVNQWTSEYSVVDNQGQEKRCFFGNRSAVLAMDRKHVKLTNVEKSIAIGHARTRRGDFRSRKAIFSELREQKYAYINQEKARKILSVELDQQVSNPHSSSKEIHQLKDYMDMIQNPARKQERKKQIELGNIVENLDKNGKFLGYSFPHLVLKLDHTTVGLLTLLGPEKEMWKNEYQALKSFEDSVNPFHLRMGNVQIEVQCEWSINMYDFGVAEISSGNLAVDGFTKAGLVGTAVAIATGVRRDQDRLNTKAYAKTMERFHTYQNETAKKLTELQGRPSTPEVEKEKKSLQEDLQKAEYLVKQIKEAGGVEKFHQLGNAYSLPARLILLEYIMGGATHFHCKSGKDRTGLLDIEIKFVAQQLERRAQNSHYQIPLFQKDERTSHRALRNQIALQSGNLDITEANTGVKGIKTTRRQAAARVFGDFAERIAGQEEQAKG